MGCQEVGAAQEALRFGRTGILKARAGTGMEIDRHLPADTEGKTAQVVHDKWRNITNTGDQNDKE